MTLPGGEVFVFVDSGVRYTLLGIVDDGISLIVTFRIYALKGDSPVPKSPKGMPEVAIDGSGIEDMIEGSSHLGGVGCPQLDLDPIDRKQSTNDLGIAVLGNSLIFCIIVVVIVVEPNRESLQNAGREF